jgi:hypothetical protein
MTAPAEGGYVWPPIWERRPVHQSGAGRPTKADRLPYPPSTDALTPRREFGVAPAGLNARGEMQEASAE